MIASHIHDAIEQVRRLQELILDRRTFRGYSGKARMMGAVTAMTGAVVMDSAWFPQTNLAHLAGWGIVLATALALNYGALFFWFAFNPQVKRNAVMLLPAVDALPGLAIGAVMSVAFILKGEFDLLFGTWMCLYGLAHVSYRQSLPPANYAVGTFYMACGSVCLLWAGIRFTNPWPMAIVFGFGEWIGGYVLYLNNRKKELQEADALRCDRVGENEV